MILSDAKCSDCHWWHDIKFGPMQQLNAPHGGCIVDPAIVPRPGEAPCCSRFMARFADSSQGQTTLVEE